MPYNFTLVKSLDLLPLTCGKKQLDSGLVLWHDRVVSTDPTTITDTATGITYRLATLDDIGDLTGTIWDEVADWFQDQPLTTHDFLDRLETTVMRTHRLHLGGSTDTPTIKAIMKIARKAKRELSID